MNFKKAISFFAWGCLLTMFIAPMIAGAQTTPAGPDVWGIIPSGAGGSYAGQSVENAIKGETGLTYKDPRVVVASIIKLALSFLGIIAVILILIGGFKWMTAGGNEEQVGDAKKWIYSGVIGILIILSAYALANFVITQLKTATTA